MEQSKVGILLPTFNGEKFLDAQLRSLRNQTFKHFTVFIRDDGSTDKTTTLIKSVCQTDSRFIQIPTTRASPLGPMKSFFELLSSIQKNHPQDFYFFCDQDDFWLPSKLEKYLFYFESLKDQGPVGIFSDLGILYKNRITHSSMRTLLGFQYPTDLWPSILVQNTVTGCTLALNFRAAEEILPTLTLGGQFGIMHDHWIAAVLSKHKALYYLPESLVLYRQHPQNASGGVGEAKIISKIRGLCSGQLKQRTFRIWRQFFALDTQAHKVLNQDGIQFLSQLHQFGLHAQGVLRTLLFWVGSAIWRRKILSQSAEWQRECSELLSSQKKLGPSKDSQKI
jgi:glycosyltransferase involved in cell wall biosynthesis